MRAQLARPEFGFDLLRVYLGIGLVIRGALFASEPALLERFIDNSSWLFPMLLAHALVLSHIVGGLMLAVGCCTRWAAAVQVPFVAGALFFVHWQEGLLAQTQSVEFAALVLVMLSLYVVCGAADFSIDHYLQRAPPEVATGEPALSWQRSLQQQRPSLPVTAARGVGPFDNVDDGRADLRAELAGKDLDVPPEPAYAREQYGDLKRELATVLATTGVLVGLLAAGLYVAAAAWFIAAFVMLVIWRIGVAQLD
jgi:uncharacterized membrane protein YphA (DoxX/SURF4 family)